MILSVFEMFFVIKLFFSIDHETIVSHDIIYILLNCKNDFLLLFNHGTQLFHILFI